MFELNPFNLRNLIIPANKTLIINAITLIMVGCDFTKNGSSDTTSWTLESPLTLVCEPVLQGYHSSGTIYHLYSSSNSDHNLLASLLSRATNVTYSYGAENKQEIVSLLAFWMEDSDYESICLPYGNSMVTVTKDRLLF